MSGNPYTGKTGRGHVILYKNICDISQKAGDLLAFFVHMA